jgi:uncharacterized membrane protein
MKTVFLLIMYLLAREHRSHGSPILWARGMPADDLSKAREGKAMAEIEGHRESSVPRATAATYLLLFPIPVVCFVAALVTDIAYSSSAYLMWLHFSEWLIAAGLAFGGLAALVLLIEFFASRAIRTGGIGWAHLVLFYGALVVELINAFVHTIDGWTAVVPTGMTLSVIGAVLALAAVGTLFRVPVTWVARREVRP